MCDQQSTIFSDSDECIIKKLREYLINCLCLCLFSSACVFGLHPLLRIEQNGQQTIV